MYYWAIKHLNDCYTCSIFHIDENHYTQKYVKYIKMGFNGAKNRARLLLFLLHYKCLKVCLKRKKQNEYIQNVK